MTDPGLHLLMTLDGGQGRDVLDALLAAGRAVTVFVAGEPADLRMHPARSLDAFQADAPGEVFIALPPGHVARRGLLERIAPGRLAQVIHPRAAVSTHAQLGRNMFVGAMAVVNPQVRIDDFVMVNAGCVLDHDCVIGSDTALGPGVVFPGHVRIGANCAVGAGVSARPGVTVTRGCVIGAGAVLAGDLDVPGVYVGNPARRLPARD